MQPHTHSTPIQALRGPGRPDSRDDATDRTLDRTLRVFAEAAELPLEPRTAEAFRATYRRSARRASDRRVWRLVGEQLVYWLTHQGQLALESARARGGDSITVPDLRYALQECWKIHATMFCDPDVPPPYRL